MRIFLILAFSALALSACDKVDKNQAAKALPNISENSIAARSATVAGVPSAAISSTVLPLNAAQAQQFQMDLQNIAGDVIFFDTNSAELSAAGLQIVDQIATWMRNNPNGFIRLAGHADERGTREFNLALGEQRANAVKNALVLRGVNAARLSTISYGKERPLVIGSDPTNWSKNRRVHVTILAS